MFYNGVSVDYLLSNAVGWILIFLPDTTVECLEPKIWADQDCWWIVFLLAVGPQRSERVHQWEPAV